MLEEQEARLQALRGARAEGEASGPAEAFDVAAFREAKRAGRP